MKQSWMKPSTPELTQKTTEVPIFKLYSDFEDYNAEIVVTVSIAGVGIDDLENAQNSILKKSSNRIFRHCSLVVPSTAHLRSSSGRTGTENLRAGPRIRLSLL